MHFYTLLKKVRGRLIIPFSTGWMGANHFAANTIALYAVLLLLCGISFTILQLTIQKSNPLTPELEVAFHTVKKKGIVSVICYSSAIPVAFASPVISGLLIALVSAIWLIPDKSIEQALKSKKTE